MKFGQFGFLFVGTAGGDANDLTGLRDAGGEVEEHEGLPVLGGGAGRGEGCVVRWE